MPTYDYSCENGHHFEEFQSMAEAPIQACPICGARATRMISGGSGLIFKGSGFYITDYVKKPGGKPTESSPSEATSSAKGDHSVKPAAKEAVSKSKSESGS